MIPGRPHITFDSMRHLLIQSQTGSYKSYKFPSHESLDDDCMFLLDPEFNHELIDQIITETWIHNDPYLPDPELDRALWDLVKLVGKYDLKDGGT